MKFLYGYKTSANEEREGEIFATSRDDVYRRLKAQGIRPFKVVLAPGVLNRIQSLGKRWLAIVILSTVATCAVVFALHTETIVRMSATSPSPRHQIYGDPALMDELARSNYKLVFDDPGLCALAHYAQPGTVVPPVVQNAIVASEIADCVNASVVFRDDEPREYRELKQIVLSMQNEVRRYLSNGKGTPELYVQRLKERQNREIQIYYTAENDVRKDNDLGHWERLNASLRSIGLKTIPMPEKRTVQAGKKSENTPLARSGEK